MNVKTYESLRLLLENLYLLDICKKLAGERHQENGMLNRNNEIEETKHEM